MPPIRCFTIFCLLVVFQGSLGIELKDFLPGIKSEKKKEPVIAKSEPDYQDDEIYDQDKSHPGEHMPHYGPYHDYDHEQNFGLLSGLFHNYPKPPVIHTQTLVLEVTRRVTRNPVCMTTRKAVPDCFPQSHEVYQHLKADNSEARNAEIYEEDFIEPSATMVSGAELSTALPGSRSARYLEFGEATPEIQEVKDAVNTAAVKGEKGVGDFIGNIFNTRPTKYVTKTIMVTKVQRVTNYGVTATLVVDNCVPRGIKIPPCPPKVTPPTITTPKPTSRPVKKPYHHYKEEQVDNSEDVKQEVDEEQVTEA